MENSIRNFYEEENRYEKLVLETKKLVEEIVNIDLEQLNKKILKIDNNLEFNEYIDLLEAVIGKNTNKFYYCKNIEDQKYYDLIVGNVYSKESLNPELQSRIQTPTKLELSARIILSTYLYDLTLKLKNIFNNNIQVGDGIISTIDDDIILRKDVEYLENLVKYIEILHNEQGRLRIVAAEQDVFAHKAAQEQYQKKSSIEKWFLKAFKQENASIESMAKKNMGRR